MNRHQFVARQPMKHARVHSFGVWAVAINLLLLGALLVMAPRVVPSYTEYLPITDLITRAAGEYEPRSELASDLKVRLANLLNTIQTYDISIDDCEIYQERGAIVIYANYEKRFPLFGYWTTS